MTDVTGMEFQEVDIGRREVKNRFLKGISGRPSAPTNENAVTFLFKEEKGTQVSLLHL